MATTEPVDIWTWAPDWLRRASTQRRRASLDCFSLSPQRRLIALFLRATIHCIGQTVTAPARQELEVEEEEELEVEEEEELEPCKCKCNGEQKERKRLKVSVLLLFLLLLLLLSIFFSSSPTNTPITDADTDTDTDLSTPLNQSEVSHFGDTPTKPAAPPTPTKGTVGAKARGTGTATGTSTGTATPEPAGHSFLGDAYWYHPHHHLAAHDQLERRSLFPLALAAASHFASARRQRPFLLSLPSEDLAHSIHLDAPPPITAAASLETLPVYPGASTLPSPPAPTAPVHRRFESTRGAAYIPHEPFVQSPFLSKASATPRRLRRLSGAARLWNPTNSTPRRPTENKQRRRRPSTPPPANVPLSHPALDNSTDPADPVSTGAGHYPLLTLPELRQSRRSGSGRGSLQFDHRGNSDHRISLPRSVRHSYDEKRATSSNPSPVDPEQASAGSVQPQEVDKGKGKAIMTPQPDEQQRGYSRDLERGPDIMDSRRHSNLSAGDGIGSAVSSDSSIMGEEVGDMGEEWGPQHPCYPHLNPHVPVDSAEYQNTRIIRVRRDWLIEGDLAPTFSNLYPEILDPAGLSEQEFRRVIEKLNGELIPIFNPYDWRNIVDSMLGLVTGWLWDDFGLTGVKARLTRLENWMDQWNKEIEKTAGAYEGASAPKLIPLRRTGYMTLDIQISDPEVAAAPSTPGASATGVMPMEPPTAVTA
ncbi:hypothetical protein BN1723_000628 [Verticillium longisporum]|uniref:Ras modification protein ERF4 n=2 Tax=Verticillium longisporum TaxID=100787 RepID=A0A0G4MY03_VERLO|nr:hypothetical protein BN1723_000628 [Verticillium longisporum]